MSPNHKLAILFGIFTNFTIILDAGWPLSDSTRSLNKISGRVGHLRNLVIDYFAFQFSTKIVFESAAQLVSASKTFKIKSEKLCYVYTGFNEQHFQDMSDVSTNPEELRQVHTQTTPIILFRGKKNLESGLDLIVQSAEQFKNDVLFVICTNSRITETPRNTIVINRHVSESELRWLYENALCVVGQISEHLRMKKTIPHKFFESAYFSKCYISPLYEGISELVDETSIIQVNAISPTGLTEAIMKALYNSTLRQKCESNLSEIYVNQISQQHLARKFRSIVNDSQ
jgi:glycosyltransferase involved in cell wall biosynthesis